MSTSDRLKNFLKKIHDPKNQIPEYITIIVRPGQKIMDFKIKKEGSNIYKIIAHEDNRRGWFLHSYHIPLRNLGLSEESKNKDILTFLNEPRLITRDKTTRELMEEVLRKFVEVLSERKKHYFKTKRFKKKKEFRMGAQPKGF